MVLHLFIQNLGTHKVKYINLMALGATVVSQAPTSFLDVFFFISVEES